MAMCNQHGVTATESNALYTTAFSAIDSTCYCMTAILYGVRREPMALQNSPVVLDKLISHSNALSFGLVKQAAPVAPAELVVDVPRLGSVAAQL